MDLVDYDQATYERIVDEYSNFATKLSIQDLTFVPISALVGDNVVHKSGKMAWYDGPTLLHHLENVNVGASRNLVDFRFPVQIVVRPHQDFRGFAGQIDSGTISPGEEVVVLPSGKASRVRAIHAYTTEVGEAVEGDSVMITLEDEIDVSRGDMIVRKNNLPQVSNQLECTICWMAEEPINLQNAYILQHGSHQVRCFVSELNYRIDVDTLHRETAHELKLNEIGRVKITTTQPLFFDPYKLNRNTGSFILIDAFNNVTVASGMIRRRSSSIDEVATAQPDRRKSTNIVWESTEISREMRETRNGHRAAVLWFTGLSGSGKSTVARRLERRLFEQGCQTTYLDGDNVRHGLNGDLGFSPADRKENIRRVAEVARLAFDHGTLTLCTFISPFAADRDFARSLLPDGRFIEIYVKCDLEVVKRRDPKGLYAKAMRGEIPEFTGVSSPYEEPTEPEIVVETDVQSVDDIVDQIMNTLTQRGLLNI
jgi:bifunctional enzyme CysN/CysC